MAILGFIGVGSMGKPMAGHLLKAGHKVFTYDVTPAGVAELVKQGATACDSCKEVAQKGDIVIVMVPDPPDGEKVLFGHNGVIEGISKGKIVMDMSSISPVATKEFAKRLAEMGVEMVDAPVSGGQVGAENATLSIMCGGKPEVFEKVK